MKLKKSAALAACGVISALAFAGSAHFVKGPTASITADGDYMVSFKEAGLGNTPITYALTAEEVIYTFQCFNPAGNKPSGDPNGVKASDVAAFATMTPRNGQITGSVGLSPTSKGASCQGNSMKLCLMAASYSGVQFADTTSPVGPIDMPPLQVTLNKPDCDVPTGED